MEFSFETKQMTQTEQGGLKFWFFWLVEGQGFKEAIQYLPVNWLMECAG